MHLHRVKIRNFRLLANTDLVFETGSTLIVGRNNSGKTSLYEVIRRFTSDTNATFQIQDFSSACYDDFCQALQAKIDSKEDQEIREHLPYIELRMFFQYDPAQPLLGPLANFVIDLDMECNEAIVVMRYELKSGAIDRFFEGLSADDLADERRAHLFDELLERTPKMYALNIWAEDPNDPSNTKLITHAAVRALLSTDFINAQRGLDDVTTRESDVLAKILEALFKTASMETADDEEREVAAALEDAVRSIQDQIDTDFGHLLDRLIPTLETFGYPGLGGSELTTETKLDVQRLLTNHTKVRYIGHSGVMLPETYNGLGMRNLIFILLQIFSFYRAFRAKIEAPGVHLIFVEEPEAHLHPQMQQVFIRQISQIVVQLNADHAPEDQWPVQFVVSTHSSHIANEAGFESIRYFLPKSDNSENAVWQTEIKDLREGLSEKPDDHKKFLHQYLTLTRCDLFFADKAILIEGTSERLLLPVMIRKLDQKQPEEAHLARQYITVIEVGGAYAHIFFDLLDFLELQSLIITDLDTVEKSGGTKCTFHEATATSNGCIKAWFDGSDCAPAALIAKSEDEKTAGCKRIAYQHPEADGGPCGRTFEDAFMLANADAFSVKGDTSPEMESDAYEKAAKVKKSEFALKHAIELTDWVTPSYILDGLRWLATGTDLVAHTSVAAHEVSGTEIMTEHEKAEDG